MGEPLNTETRIGGWMKAVFMQEGNLPTVADCCRLAALVEHSVRPRFTEEQKEAVRVMASAAEGIAQESEERGGNVTAERYMRRAKALRSLLEAE